MYAMVGLDNLKFSRTELVTILKSNRSDHIRDWEAADKLYRSAIYKASLALGAATDDCLNPKAENMTSLYRRYDQAVKDIRSLARPQNCVEHYDRAISMLELTLTNEIELTQVLYSQLVLDNWEWAGEYAAAKLSNSNYME